MRNWSIDESKMAIGSPQHKKWRTEQLINFGLQGETLDRTYIGQHIDESNIDERKRHYLKFLLRHGSQANSNSNSKTASVFGHIFS